MKPITKRFEFRPDGVRFNAYRRAEAVVAAAVTLELPVRLEEVTYEEFRHGGNVTKAHCRAYLVTVGDEVPHAEGD